MGKRQTKEQKVWAARKAAHRASTDLREVTVSLDAASRDALQTLRLRHGTNSQAARYALIRTADPDLLLGRAILEVAGRD